MIPGNDRKRTKQGKTGREPGRESTRKELLLSGEKVSIFSKPKAVASFMRFQFRGLTFPLSSISTHSCRSLRATSPNLGSLPLPASPDQRAGHSLSMSLALAGGEPKLLMSNGLQFSPCQRGSTPKGGGGGSLS